jgi:hypothetical protein
VQTKPLSVLHSIAEHYHRDARDFASRFDALWEIETHKTCRIKSFVDLLMACECALKSHVALGRVTEDPTDVYITVRKASHQIASLAGAARFLKDRTVYNELSSRLQAFSVFIRYSLDAYETFFPSYVERHEAKLNYTKTIGNNLWVLEVRALLQPLLESAGEAFSGFVTDDIEAIIDHERQMKEFMESVAK